MEQMEKIGQTQHLNTRDNNKYYTFNDWVGRTLKIVFNDGVDHVSIKIGICTRENEIEIVLDDKHLIIKNKIIRVEVL